MLSEDPAVDRSGPGGRLLSGREPVLRHLFTGTLLDWVPGQHVIPSM